MGDSWVDTFRRRMAGFVDVRPGETGEIPVSIKVGVTFGCFHREHSPRAYVDIDRYLGQRSPAAANLAFEEHESGPEILTYVALGAAGLNLAAGIVGLVTAIVNARSRGIRDGDDRRDPLRLRIRRTRSGGDFEEEVVVEVDWHHAVTEEEIERALMTAATKLLRDELTDCN
jgi:hypothetical protein